MTKSRAPKTLILVMVAGLASSLPTMPLAARSNDFDGLFAICPGVLWKGEACQSLEWKSGQCYIVPPTLRGTVQSASPHQGASGICTLYHGNNCFGEGTPPIAYPGIDNFEMSGLYSPFQSWRCVKAPF